MRTFFGILFALFLCANAGLNLDGYNLVWNQDFTTMDKLSVTPWGPGSTWIAHTPSHGDWVCFMDPSGPFMPFNVGGGQPLTIRAQQYKNQFCGGLLASVDSQGTGFTNGYGYFEMLAQLPPGPGTWPAFWLLDVESQIDQKKNAQEIDILEQYANGPSYLRTTLHLWEKNGSKSWGDGVATIRCDMTSGFHTYGLDLQPDYLTFYYDRLAIWQMPNTVPGYNDKYDRNYYVLVNLALEEWAANLTSPQDMLVKYVKVWTGSGGSKNAFDTSDSDSVTYPTSGLRFTGDQTLALKNVTLVWKSGDLQIQDGSGNQLWHSNTPQTCGTGGCVMNFQNDGNLVFFNDGKPYWASDTWGNNMGSISFFNYAPYLEIKDENCLITWSTWGRP